MKLYVRDERRPLTNKISALLGLLVQLLVMWLVGPSSFAQPVIRVSQLGFRPDDLKTAVVLADSSMDRPAFTVIDRRSGEEVLTGVITPLAGGYGDFSFAGTADVTALRHEGTYTLKVDGIESPPLSVGETVFRPFLHYPMSYILEQRCGANPVFDTICHQLDAIAVDGPDSGTVFDMRGGYHDASDYLRFLITTSYSTGILLMTYKEYPGLWPDSLDDRGKRMPNGVPDILDEARWGLEWMLKLAPGSKVLYHQVADDRDHAFWDLPYRDSTDYGWGRGKYRPAYFAAGKPQGLLAHQNNSTGLSNIAGRTAAVFALASWIWREKLSDEEFSSRLSGKAAELYLLGKDRPGSSESVPCKAPYRYHEKTFHDDMEWAAAELYRATGKKDYLAEGITYAHLAADTSWMGLEETKHYEYFPYVNLGHYELAQFVDDATRKKLAEYYRAGLLRAEAKGSSNAFGYGVPFIWVSNNLATGLITQAILYRKMTASEEFDGLLFRTRDWLLGRNPWGQSFIIGVPETGTFPTDPHSVVTKELGIRLTGALVDGPVYGSIFSSLRGIRLTRPDRFAAFQTSTCVYHDDLGDYSTNEPTLDGTASLMFIFAHFSQ